MPTAPKLQQVEGVSAFNWVQSEEDIEELASFLASDSSSKQSATSTYNLTESASKRIGSFLQHEDEGTSQDVQLASSPSVQSGPQKKKRAGPWTSLGTIMLLLPAMVQLVIHFYMPSCSPPVREAMEKAMDWKVYEWYMHVWDAIPQYPDDTEKTDAGLKEATPELPESIDGKALDARLPQECEFVPDFCTNLGIRPTVNHEQKGLSGSSISTEKALPTASMDPSIDPSKQETFTDDPVVNDASLLSVVSDTTRPDDYSASTSDAVLAQELDEETESFIKQLNSSVISAAAFNAAAINAVTKREGVKVRIAITGQSGAGKSTLVNTLRGIPPWHDAASPVSSIQTTGVTSEFRKEGYVSTFTDDVVYYDLPGCGTKAIPRETYVNSFELEQYDAFILVTQQRVDENDIWLRETLRNMSKTVFIVRNKVNIDVAQEFEDHRKTQSETLGSIRTELIAEFDLEEDHLKKDLFLISAKLADHRKYDMPRLKQALRSSLGKLMALSLVGHPTELFIEQEKVVRRHIVLRHASLAALNSGLNPFPLAVDTIVNLALVLSMNHEIAESFGLNRTQVEGSLKGVGHVAAAAASGLAQEFSASFLTTEAVKHLCGEMFKAEVMKVVPVVGGVVAAASEFWLIRWLGFHVTSKAREAAERIQLSLLEEYERDRPPSPLALNDGS